MIAGVAVALDGCGVPVRTLTLRTPTLDDVFLQVTGTHLSDSRRAPDQPPSAPDRQEHRAS